MRYFVFLLLIIGLFSQNGYCFPTRCKLIITILEKPLPGGKFKMVVWGGGQSRPKIEVPVTQNTTIIEIEPNEPFYYNVSLYRNDSLVAESGSFMANAKVIYVTFKAIKSPAEIRGGENEYIAKHRHILFDVPHSIAKHKEYNMQAIKEQYDFKPKDIILELYWREYETAMLEIIAARRNYYFILIQLNKRRIMLPVKFLETAFNLLSNEIKSTKTGKSLDGYIKGSKKLFVGKMAPSFNVYDEAENTIHSSNFVTPGSYTLIDFWASWCRPCRESMKMLKEKYYPKLDTSRIKIVSISIDEQKNDWLKAEKAIDVPWKSYWAQKIENNDVQKILNFNYVPFYIIVGPDGNISAINMFSSDLEKFFTKNGLLISNTQ